MLARKHRVCQMPAWRRDLAGAVRDLGELLRVLDLEPGQLPPLPRSPPSDFPLLAPRAYVDLMQRGDPNDPLLRQVLPLAIEGQARPGFAVDAVGDGLACRAPGLLQKYTGRALLIPTNGCALHCRFCFRRHARRNLGLSGRRHLAAAIAKLSADESIREVILSGGDPLLLDDQALSELVSQLAGIPHLHRLRVHSRIPIALPSRVDAGLGQLLAQSRLRVLVVIHINHARELAPPTQEALASLRRAGLPLLAQAVLLKGINDDVERLCELSEALFDHGVLPYYLHLLDRVRGVGHFEVPEQHAVQLLTEMRARLPGYLVPRLVREIVGRPAKTPIGH